MNFSYFFSCSHSSDFISVEESTHDADSLHLTWEYLNVKNEILIKLKVSCFESDLFIAVLRNNWYDFFWKLINTAILTSNQNKSNFLFNYFQHVVLAILICDMNSETIFSQRDLILWIRIWNKCNNDEIQSWFLAHAWNFSWATQ